MTKDLYGDNGRPDYDKLEKLSGTVNILIGGRRIGKTFGFFKFWVERQPGAFLYLRTTKAAIDKIFNNETSPLSPINDIMGVDLQPSRIPGSPELIGIYDAEEMRDSKGKPVIKGKPVGYAMSIQDMAAIRGFNLDNVTEIIFDEFIKHPGEIVRNYKNLDQMYHDIYFTINNERESRGEEPLRSWLLGNSDNLDNPILTGWHLVSRILQLEASGGNYYHDKYKGISVFLFNDAPISTEFKKGKVARLMEGTSYYDMAYENDFVNDDLTNCGLQAVGQYKPLFVYQQFVISAHKRHERIYCYKGSAAGVPAYTNTKISKAAMLDDFGRLYFTLLGGCMYFDTYETKLVILDAFGWK